MNVGVAAAQAIAESSTELSGKPLLQLVANNTRRRSGFVATITRTGNAPNRAAVRPRPAPGMAVRAVRADAPKILFLAEFEIRGDIHGAVSAAGCTAADVRHWRETDQRFSRDFTLAALAHVNGLKRQLELLAEAADDRRSHAARELLSSEDRYRDADGRLDLRAWRDALKSLLPDREFESTGW